MFLRKDDTSKVIAVENEEFFKNMFSKPLNQSSKKLILLVSLLCGVPMFNVIVFLLAIIV